MTGHLGHMTDRIGHMTDWFGHIPEGRRLRTGPGWRSGFDLCMTFIERLTRLAASATRWVTPAKGVRTNVRHVLPSSGRTSVCVLASGPRAEGVPEAPAYLKPTTRACLCPNTRRTWVGVNQEHDPCTNSIGRAIYGSSTLTYSHHPTRSRCRASAGAPPVQVCGPSSACSLSVSPQGRTRAPSLPALKSARPVMCGRKCRGSPP
jgi:hypothetical protein